ncbi:MAG: S1C family serine protease [Trueperaceae bacterium]|nr:S1C family serine protease [Trueperaceae bacterium]
MDDERGTPRDPSRPLDGDRPDAESAYPVPAPVEEPPRRRGVRGVTVALMALLLLVATVVPRMVPEPAPQQAQVQASPPAPVAPEGALAKAYELARPATVRVEARCAGMFRGGPIGVGTGFFVSPEGDLLTAYHVIDASGVDACPVQHVAVTEDGRELNLTLTGFDAYFDVAWMQAATEGEVPYLTLAGDTPRAGTEVVAIGNSRGDFLAPRAGRITRLGVQAGRANFASDTIELTAAVAPGDSGGPVVDAAGRAVGVVSYISFAPGSLDTERYVPPFLRGLNLPGSFASYAVPVRANGELVRALRAGEQRDVPVIGFSWRPGFDYAPERSDWSFGPRPGPVVVSVAPGGPADEAGLRSYREEPIRDSEGRVIEVERSGDVITAVDGEPTPTFDALLSVVRAKRIGESVTLSVQRGRATLRLELTLGARRDVFAGP